MQPFLAVVAVPVMLLFTLASGSAPSARAQDPEGFTSDTAKKAAAKYTEQVAKLDEEYAGRLKKISDQYVKDLEVARKVALARPDLDEAQRVLNAQTQAAAAPAPPMHRRGLVIMAARWGALTRWDDVTDKVRDKIKDAKLSLVPEEMGFADPIDGVRKSLAVMYSMNGRIDLILVGDGQPLELPPAAKR